MIKPKSILETAHSEVEEAVKSGVEVWSKRLGSVTPNYDASFRVRHKTVSEALETVVANKKNNKYLFSILVTTAVKKIETPSQDVRLAQSGMPGGFSNRSLDEKVVTPFLKFYGYTSCAASGVESGRNFEKGDPWNLDFRCNPRGPGNKEAFLSIVDYVQREGGHDVLCYLLYLDAIARDSEQPVDRPPMESNSLRVLGVLNRHFLETSGQGKARLPVLAVYVVVELLSKEILKYEDATVDPLERHTTSDLRSGSVGDISISRENHAVEGFEIKSERPVGVDTIRTAIGKIKLRQISRYWVLSTNRPLMRSGEESQIKEMIQEALDQYGSEIVVMNLVDWLKAALSLLKDVSPVLTRYSEELVSDSDVRENAVSSWNDILTSEYGDD